MRMTLSVQHAARFANAGDAAWIARLGSPSGT